MLLLIVQDEVTFVVFGVSVLVALTRIGPGLAAVGAGRNPEGIAGQFARERPSRRRPRVDAEGAPNGAGRESV